MAAASAYSSVRRRSTRGGGRDLRFERAVRRTEEEEEAVKSWGPTGPTTDGCSLMKDKLEEAAAAAAVGEALGGAVRS